MNLRKLVTRQPFTPLGLVAIGAGVLAIILIVIVVASWRSDREAAAQAKAGAVLGQARSRSAIEAAVIADVARDNAIRSEALSRENADAIRQAPGAAQAIDPGLNDAGRRSLCRRASYRRTEECVQLLGAAQP